MPLRARLALALAVLSAAVLLPAHAAFAFSDVPSNYWDYGQIKYVAVTRTWMQDYGPKQFQPTTLETRSFLARTLVTVYAPNEAPDPSITFSDLPPSDPFYRFANVAVKLGWIGKMSGNRWNGSGSVRTDLFDQAIVLAMGGFTAPLAGLASIHQADGTPYVVGPRFPHQQLARWLGLHYDHANERLDLLYKTPIKRDEVAYSLWRARTLPSWKITDAQRFDDIKLPVVPVVQQQLTTFALKFVGYPYVWAGEWKAASPPGYCCGYQPIGGFDCSGFSWWVLKKNEGGYNAAQFRPYPGWSLLQRSSYQIAQATKTRLTYAQLRPGNLVLTASDGGKRWQDVDHVGIYLGNGWMIHSTGDGAQLQWVGNGYYRDHFVWGRKL